MREGRQHGSEGGEGRALSDPYPVRPLERGLQDISVGLPPWGLFGIRVYVGSDINTYPEHTYGSAHMTQDIFGRKFFPHPSEAMSLILKDLDRQSSSLSWGRNRPCQLIFKALNDQTR